MYQFYYADEVEEKEKSHYQQNIASVYAVTAIRPAMWEEHCLECSAPLCFESCPHYRSRSDGRCKRLENGIAVSENPLGCGGQAVRLSYRKWANMMTLIYPAMVSLEDYQTMIRTNDGVGKFLRKGLKSRLPQKGKWTLVRGVEFLRRRNLKKLKDMDNVPDAFLFHGYSFQKEDYQLIVEAFVDSHTSAFRMSLTMHEGENLYIIDQDEMSKACWTTGYRIKIYPENDVEADLEILWCDFVKGHRITAEQPASTVKCVVWDLDNTLWDGTLIETDHPDNLHFKPHVLETMKELDQRGIIQSIASKNDFDVAWEIVKKLGAAEYILYPQIHWNAKSSSMKQIAKCLNIGIDSLALIDDSVYERNQVQSVLPQVRVYDEKIIEGLLQLPEFAVASTEESSNRRKMYQAEEQRHQLQQSENSDTVDFLKKCHLQLELFVPTTEDEIQRCFELVVRTNQLNMSGIKYTQDEFDTVLQRKDCCTFAFSLEDNFGAYGIVGFGQYQAHGGKLTFTEFAMSCRAAGKYVESALFAYLLEQVNCNSGMFAVKKTPKNGLLRRTLEEIGFAAQNDTEKEVHYSFTAQLKNREIVEVRAKINAEV